MSSKPVNPNIPITAFVPNLVHTSSFEVWDAPVRRIQNKKRPFRHWIKDSQQIRNEHLLFKDLAQSMFQSLSIVFGLLISHFELQQKTLAPKELPKFPRVHWFVFRQIMHGKWLNCKLFRNLISCIPTKGGFKNWLVGTKESYKTSTKERYRRLFGANILINLLYTSVWTKLPLFICAYISSLIYSNHYFTFSQRSYFNSLTKGPFF